jgi:large-conductance mechanosensitive channel
MWRNYPLRYEYMDMAVSIVIGSSFRKEFHPFQPELNLAIIEKGPGRFMEMEEDTAPPCNLTNPRTSILKSYPAECVNLR